MKGTWTICYASQVCSFCLPQLETQSPLSSSHPQLPELNPFFHQHIIPPHSSSYQSLVYLDVSFYAQVWNFWVYSSVEAPLVCDGYPITKMCLHEITSFSQRMLMAKWLAWISWPALFTKLPPTVHQSQLSYLICICLFLCNLPPLYPSLNPLSSLPFSRTNSAVILPNHVSVRTNTTHAPRQTSWQTRAESSGIRLLINSCFSSPHPSTLRRGHVIKRATASKKLCFQTSWHISWSLLRYASIVLEGAKIIVIKMEKDCSGVKRMSASSGRTYYIMCEDIAWPAGRG